jgi:hypothetical protein
VRAPASAPELAAVARPALDAARRAVDGCRLVAIDPGFWFDYVMYDRCAWKEGEVAAYREKAAALAAYAVSHDLPLAARTFADHARLFGEWLALAERADTTRGTVRLFQDLALAYDAYDPEHRVDPDPPGIVKQYTEDFGVPIIHYIWESHRRYELHRAKPRPLLWRDGAQGPFLAD